MKKERQNKRKSYILIFVILLLLLVLSTFFLYPPLVPIYDNNLPPNFDATRRGVIFETGGGLFADTIGELPSVSRSIRTCSINAVINRTFISETVDALEFLSYGQSPVITSEKELKSSRMEEDDEDENILKSFDQNSEKKLIGHFSIVTKDKVTGEELANRKLFSFPAEQSIHVVGIISERLILFGKSESIKEESGSWEDRYNNLFWYVLNDGEWQRRPFDCELPEYALTGWEIIQEEGLLFLLLHSSKDNENYLVKFNYNSLSIVQTTRLEEQFDGRTAFFRILTNEKHLFVFEQVSKGDKKEIQGCVYSTNDLTKVTRVMAPIDDWLWRTEQVVLSPNLRYLAYKGGDSSLYVYDTTLKTTTRLRKKNSAFWRRYLWNFWELDEYDRHWLAGYSDVWSLSFSTDSQTLYDANMIGDLFVWNMENKKLNYRVTCIRR